MTDVAQLVQRLDAILAEQVRMREALDEMKRERDEYHRLYLEMLERNRQLERGMLAPVDGHVAPEKSASMGTDPATHVRGAHVATSPA